MTFKAAQFFPNRLLAFYQSRLEQQQKELNRIREALPTLLAQHTVHCVIDEKKLLLYTDSAVWASQLRFYKNAILTSIAWSDENTARVLQIRILPEKTSRFTKFALKPNIPSPDKIDMIRNHSDNITDSELKLALKKLSLTLSRL